MNIFEGVAFLLLTFLVVGFCAITQTRRITCPAGYFVNGVRENGASECIRDSDVPASFRVRIYCTDGMRPLSHGDGRTIRCGWGTP